MSAAESPAVWPLVIADLQRGKLVDPAYENVAQSLIRHAQQRHEFGLKKYGAPLRVHMPERPVAPIRDALDEALDLVAYTRQHYEAKKSRNAWQLHLSACAIAVLVLAEMEAP